MSLIVSKNRRSLEIGGAVIGNGDTVDGIKFTRRGYTWHAESAKADNHIVLKDVSASFELTLDESAKRLYCRKRYPALEALPVQGKISWVGGNKPICFRVSPQQVFAGRAIRLVADRMPNLPETADRLVSVTTTGSYAATVELAPEGPRLLDVVIRVGADVDKAVQAIKDGIAAYAAMPSVNALSTAFSDALKGVAV